MNLISIKRTDDMQLKGVTIDAEWRDKQLAAVTLTDGDGKIVRFAVTNYTVQAYISAPPERKKVHVVSGTVPTLGAPIREEFEEPYQATMRRSELEQADVCDSVAVAVEEVEIPF